MTKNGFVKIMFIFQYFTIDIGLHIYTKKVWQIILIRKVNKKKKLKT